MEINIPNEYDVGYTSALYEVLKIRQNRFNIYRDDWRKLGFDGNMFHIQNKMGRIEMLIKKHKEQGLSDDERMSLLDSLYDLVNYSLFLAALVEDER